MTTTLTFTCQYCGAEWETGPAPDVPATLAREPQAMCQRCQDIREDEWVAGQEANRMRDRRQASERRCGIPKRLRGLSFDGLDRMGNAEAFAAAHLWANGELEGLVLHGDVGVGKTTLAAIAAWQRSTVAQWVSVPSMIARTFGDQDSKAEVAATLTGSGPLVLDDIDKVKSGEWVAAQLFTAVDGRIAAGAPLLVTSNLRVSELADTLGGRFGEAIASRLAGHCELHQVVGADRRLG